MRKITLGILSVLIISNSNLWSCAVCFGDPNSPMTHGAKAAVFFMLGIVGVVLGAILGVALYWIHRARLLQVQAAIRGESTNL